MQIANPAVDNEEQNVINMCASAIIEALQ